MPFPARDTTLNPGTAPANEVRGIVRSIKRCLALVALAHHAAGWAQSDDQRFTECQQMLKAAQSAQILDDILPRKRGLPAQVLVGPNFFKLSLKSREGFSKAMNCLLVAGAADKCMNFDLLHWQSGTLVAKYENCVYKPR